MSRNKKVVGKLKLLEYCEFIKISTVDRDFNEFWLGKGLSESDVEFKFLAIGDQTLKNEDTEKCQNITDHHVVKTFLRLEKHVIEKVINLKVNIIN